MYSVKRWKNINCEEFKFTIYALVDPITLQFRYIGITEKELRWRFYGHMRSAKLGEKSHKALWIRKLLREGLEPLLWVVEITSDPYREFYWIAEYRLRGFDLTNRYPGGVTTYGMKGKHHTEGSKKKSSESNFGKKRSASTKEKISQDQKQRWADPEYKAKMCEIRKKQADTHRETISRAGKEKWSDPEYKAKMLIVRQEQGKRRKGNFTAETLQKMSDSMKKTLAKKRQQKQGGENLG